MHTQIVGAHHHAQPPPCCGMAKRKEKEKRVWKKRARTRKKGVVFVGDFVAHHDGEWIVVVAKW